SGSAYVAGHTGSTDFPTTAGALQRTFGGGNEFGGDAFVARLNQSGANLVYSTYIGGEAADVGRAIAIDAAGNAYVTGTTQTTGFATNRGLEPGNAGGCADVFSNCTDAFVAKLNPSGSALVYSTYLGGGSRASVPFAAGDSGAAIAVDAAGSA